MARMMHNNCCTGASQHQPQIHLKKGFSLLRKGRSVFSVVCINSTMKGFVLGDVRKQGITERDSTEKLRTSKRTTHKHNFRCAQARLLLFGSSHKATTEEGEKERLWVYPFSREFLICFSMEFCSYMIIDFNSMSG